MVRDKNKSKLQTYFLNITLNKYFFISLIYIIQGVIKVYPTPHLTVKQMKISNCASGAVYITKINVFWCIQKFNVFHKIRVWRVSQNLEY